MKHLSKQTLLVAAACLFGALTAGGLLWFASRPDRETNENREILLVEDPQPEKNEASSVEVEPEDATGFVTEQNGVDEQVTVGDLDTGNSELAADPSQEDANVELDDDWGSLPELVVPEEAPQRVEAVPPAAPPQPEENAATEESVPELPPKGRVWELPDALWQAGLLNGTPAHEKDTISFQEYGESDRTDAVLHVRSPQECPAFLQPGQKLILHLPGFETGLYTVHVATTGGTASSVREEARDKERHNQRYLSIRWNDHLIWRRTVSPVHAISRAVPPPGMIQPDSNLLMLENEGKAVLPLDSVWVSPFSYGEHPFYVAAEQAEWLNRTHAPWIKHVVVEVPLIPTTASQARPDPGTRFTSPTSVSETQGRWPDAMRRVHALVKQEHPSVPQLRTWHQRIGHAVARGMMVDVRVEPSPDTKGDLSPALWAYGDLVHRWILPSGRQSASLEREIRSRIPDARIVKMSGQDRGTLSGQNRFAWWDSQYAIQRGSMARDYFDEKLSQEDLGHRLDTLVNVRALFFAYMGYKLAWHSDSFYQVAGEYLMESGQALIVHGLHPGGPYFPAGNDHPSLLWAYTKSMFRFGGPDHRQGLANLTGDSNVLDLRRTTWAVADNQKDSVQVLIHNSIHLNGKRVNLELPLPWEGSTRVVLHHTTSQWNGRAAAPETTLTRNVINPHTFSTQDGKNRNWVSLPVTLSGIQLVELHPEAYVSRRNIQAPAEVGYSFLMETDQLFEVSTTPPPAWWSRNKLGAHFYPMWRHSGDVTYQVEVPATRDEAVDWAGKQQAHISVEQTYEAVTPLRENSTRFRFGTGDGKIARVMRAGYHRSRTYKGETIGLWIRANRPPDFKAKVDLFHAKPQTHFYMGKLPYRQRIDVEYDKWYFITSDAEIWRSSVSRHEPFLVFWPGDPVDGNPEIEVNSFEVYQSRLENTNLTPGECMGFVRETEDGNVHVLVLGRPGQAAFWRQRLPFQVDPKRMRHVVDKELLTTADTPEEDPPEVVRHHIDYFEDSRVLEVGIEQIPQPPSESHMKVIEATFPLLAKDIRNHQLGAMLISEQELEPTP